MSAATPRASNRTALHAIAFLSGAAALLYQAVWLQWFRVLFGNTAYAASATLCAFFAGLALGAELFGRVAERSQNPLRTYAKVEVVAAGLALLVPLGFALYDPLYAALYDTFFEQRAIFVALKFLLALTVMLPPAILLGGTFPLLATGTVSDSTRLGGEGAMLYAVNTMGAAAGSALGLLWLPEVVGVRGTYGVAIAVSLVAAALAWRSGVGRGAPIAQASPLETVPNAGEVATAPAALLGISFASGLGTLALEVLVIQAIARILDHSVYSLGSVLVVVLLALGSGAAIASLCARRVGAKRLLGIALALEALMLLFLPALIELQTHDIQNVSLGQALLLVAWLGGPPLLVGALVFPLTFELASGGSVGRRVGGLLAANTTGAIIGSLAASFLLLDLVGLWISLFLLGIGYGMAWIAQADGMRTRLARAGLLGLAVAGVATSAISPVALPRVALRSGDRLIDLDEGAYGVVSVVGSRNSLRMMLNNQYILSGYGPLHAAKERQGHLPLILHPDPHSALFLGSSTGGTAGAATLHPLSELVLVELVPQVQALAAQHFSATSRHVYRDPRTRIVVEDGRNHLRATHDYYDVIVADLFLPWRPGVGSLFTREHFQAARDRLTPNGVFCQWLPVYQYDSEVFASAVATFLEVFPEATVWRSSFSPETPAIAMVGFAGAVPSESQIEQRVLETAARAVEDRWVTQPEGFWMLYMGALTNLKPAIAGAPVNRDDWPIFEFLAGRSTKAAIDEFHFLGWPAQGVAMMTAEIEAGKTFGDRARAGIRAAHLLAVADAAFLAGRPDVTRQMLEQLRALVPASLLSPPDPSAAALWKARPATVPAPPAS